MDKTKNDDKPLYILVPNVVLMDIKKIIMDNGNRYELIWDEKVQVNDDYLRMVDLTKGWVELNRRLISEMIDVGTLKDQKVVLPQIRKLIIEFYGQDIFSE